MACLLQHATIAASYASSTTRTSLCCISFAVTLHLEPLRSIPTCAAFTKFAIWYALLGSHQHLPICRRQATNLGICGRCKATFPLSASPFKASNKKTESFPLPSRRLQATRNPCFYSATRVFAASFGLLSRQRDCYTTALRLTKASPCRLFGWKLHAQLRVEMNTVFSLILSRSQGIRT